MKLVNQTDVLDRALGCEGAVNLIGRTGFDGVDLSMFGLFDENDVWNREDYREHAAALRAYTEEQGMEILQAHAPFTTGTTVFSEYHFEKVVRAMEIAAIAGAPRIVVHPLQHLPYRANREYLFRLSVDFYRRLIPFCEQFGIQVCTENMWQYDPHRPVITQSVCADPAEMKRMLEEIGSPRIGACLDIGHCALVGFDPADAVRTLGSRWLRCLHVHDVDYVRDCHTMPFLEKLDWASITKALKETGFSGPFTFETHSFFAGMPEELWEAAGILLQKTGRYLIRQIEA